MKPRQAAAMPIRAVILALSLAVAGCASTPPPSAASLPWLDSEFLAGGAAVDAVRASELFKLDDELERRLADPAVREVAAGRRLRYLMDTILGEDRKGFGYRTGKSGIAAETWRDRAGDCLSLTVLTYSMARKLGLNPVMQEVRTPPLFGRTGELDVVSQHVNVLVPNMRGDLFMESSAHDVVIDFEPDESGVLRRGVPLSEQAIVARFYNNLGVEHMARGEPGPAYSHFKAAIEMEPGFVSPYGNLAVLYRRIGRVAEAERLLRRAVALGGNSDVALHGLHSLLADSGRLDDAREVARELEARRSTDPYHWIGLGLQALRSGALRTAVEHFERARAIAPAFAEVPRYLAHAYAGLGDLRRAREELARAEGLGGHLHKVAMLRRKLDDAAQGPR